MNNGTKEESVMGAGLVCQPPAHLGGTNVGLQQRGGRAIECQGLFGPFSVSP